MSYLEDNLKYFDKATGYDAISNIRRRYIIRLLDEAETPLSLQKLATEIAQWECEDSNEAVEKEAVKDVYISLYHHHVPKLADAGFVAYDRDEREVELSQSAPLQIIEQLEA